MAALSHSLPALNPPKTLSSNKTSFLPSTMKFRSKNHSNPTSLTITVSSTHNSLDALASSSLRREDVLSSVRDSLSSCLSETYLDRTVPGLQSKTRGKVRDTYESGDYLVLVTTDRQSAFDRVLASIPFKGQVLNETSLWWFNQTRHITPNAVVSAPDKNVTIAKKCSVFPVEFVVRGFVTGSTDTSLWTVYNKGVRCYCGNILPEGLVKNQKLPANIITPTTKAVDHDVPIAPEEIVERGLMTQSDYDEASSKALSLFEYGQRVALEHGLLLVDTKYEFGKGSDGTVLLIDEVCKKLARWVSGTSLRNGTLYGIRWAFASSDPPWRLADLFDEVHTPDSSRYWIADSYKEHFQNGLEPENVDKEFLRLWFKDHCNPYEDEVLPAAPEDLVCELAWRYIFLFETITKSKFEMPGMQEPIHERISRNVSQALSYLQ